MALRTIELRRVSAPNTTVCAAGSRDTERWTPSFTTFVTKTELAEQLRPHGDVRVGEISRGWMFSCMGMQAATIAGVLAAVRL